MFEYWSYLKNSVTEFFIPNFDGENNYEEEDPKEEIRDYLDNLVSDIEYDPTKIDQYLTSLYYQLPHLFALHNHAWLMIQKALKPFSLMPQVKKFFQDVEREIIKAKTATPVAPKGIAEEKEKIEQSKKSDYKKGFYQFGLVEKLVFAFGFMVRFTSVNANEIRLNTDPTISTQVQQNVIGFPLSNGNFFFGWEGSSTTEVYGRIGRISDASFQFSSNSEILLNQIQQGQQQGLSFAQVSLGNNLACWSSSASGVFLGTCRLFDDTLNPLSGEMQFNLPGDFFQQSNVRINSNNGNSLISLQAKGTPIPIAIAVSDTNVNLPQGNFTDLTTGSLGNGQFPTSSSLIGNDAVAITTEFNNPVGFNFGYFQAVNLRTGGVSTPGIPIDGSNEVRNPSVACNKKSVCAIAWEKNSLTDLNARIIQMGMFNQTSSLNNVFQLSRFVNETQDTEPFVSALLDGSFFVTYLRNFPTTTNIQQVLGDRVSEEGTITNANPIAVSEDATKNYFDAQSFVTADNQVVVVETREDQNNDLNVYTKIQPLGPVVLKNSLTITGGTSVKLTPNDISVQIPGAEANLNNAIIIVVDNLQNGLFNLNNFTFAAVLAGSVVFTSNGLNLKPAYNLVFSDGQFQVKSAAIVNFTPGIQVVNNGNSAVIAGAVVGSVAGATAIIVAIGLFARRRSQNKKLENERLLKPFANQVREALKKDFSNAYAGLKDFSTVGGKNFIAACETLRTQFEIKNLPLTQDSCQILAQLMKTQNVKNQVEDVIHYLSQDISNQDIAQQVSDLWSKQSHSRTASTDELLTANSTPMQTFN